MANYSTEFDGYTLDVRPSDWTFRWEPTNAAWAVKADSGAAAGRLLQSSSTSDSWNLLSMDAVDGDADRANVEVLTRVRTRTPSASSLHQIMLVARASGLFAQGTAYMLSFSSNANGGIRLRKIVSGSVTNLGSEYTTRFGWAAETWYYLRFRVNGSNLYGKIWKDGDPEPSEWQVTATDTEISAAGWVGVGNYESSGTTRDFDFVSIGTNGDSATLSTSSSTNVKVGAAAVEAMLDSTPNAVVHQSVLEVAIGQEVPAHVHQLVLEVMYLPEPSAAQPNRQMIMC